MNAMRLLTLALFLVLRSPLALTTVGKLETVEFNKTNALTCGQHVTANASDQMQLRVVNTNFNQEMRQMGLTDCKVNPGDFCVYCDDRVYVSGLAADALLCHSQGWRPCLRIQLNITTEGSHEDSGVSGEAVHEDERGEEHGSSQDHLTAASDLASVQVCYSSPDSSGSKELTFTPYVSTDHPTQMWMSLIVELPEYHFGSKFTVYSSATHNFSKQVMLPSIDTVCSQGLNIPLCNVPIVREEIDHTTGMFKLHIDDAGRDILRELGACQRMGTDTDCFTIEWKDNPLMIPMSSAAPCLCFQVWWKTSEIRKEFCPFHNVTVLSGVNVSVSVVEQRKTHDGTIHGNTTALVWNITAPCRLEGEIQLCKKTSSDTHCHEIHDSKKTSLHSHHHLKWRQHKQHWQFQGEFAEVERHPSLCVQIKVKGMEGHFEPVCPFEVTRTRWSSVFLVCAVLVCLTVLGVCAVQGALKGWVFRWLKVDDIRGAVGGGHVVLLYPPDADGGLAELVCRLGSGLSSLGFSVSLDLWSRSELSALGPVPWLHSRLDRVQRHGGKVVLVLTQAAWARAEEWGRRAGAREELKMGEEDNGHHFSPTPYSDVFSASLSCILADYLQGRAGERFVLAQFEAQPAGPPGAGGPLPELFRGLPLFSLPSQSLGFLTELANGTQKRPAGRAANRRMRAGVLRAGSRTLAEALRELKGGTGYKLVALSQGFRTEDPWESIPLQQGLSSPMTSPELRKKSSTVDWV